MAKQRVPRRTLKLTRYLESVLVDPKASAAMKQVASGRLTDLFLAASADKARREIAIARAETRAEIAALEKTAPDTSVSPQVNSEPDPAAERERQAKAALDAYLDEFKTRQLGKVEGAVST